MDWPEPDRFELAVQEVTEGLADLLVSKQKDYGPDAINNAPGGALNGINVRLHDKLSRAINLTGAVRLAAVPVNHESLIDTYRDLANYAIIATLVLTDEWPS